MKKTFSQFLPTLNFESPLKHIKVSHNCFKYLYDFIKTKCRNHITDKKFVRIAFYTPIIFNIIKNILQKLNFFFTAD